MAGVSVGRPCTPPRLSLLPGRYTGCGSARAPGAPPADRRRPAGADGPRQGRHPPARRDAVRRPVVDRRVPEFERGFLSHHWEARASWSIDDWRLNLMVEADGRPIGSQSAWGHAFPVHRTVDTGSWLGREFQGRGLGKEMRSAVLSFVFDGLGAGFAESSAFLDNAASNAVSRASATRRTAAERSRPKACRARRSGSGCRPRAGARGHARRSRWRVSRSLGRCPGTEQVTDSEAGRPVCALRVLAPPVGDRSRPKRAGETAAAEPQPFQVPSRNQPGQALPADEFDRPSEFDDRPLAAAFDRDSMTYVG